MAAGIDANEAALDVSILARQTLGWDMAHLIAHETDPPAGDFPPAFERLIARRASREPISSIVGLREFCGLEFEVGPDVLAPRPETEIIIDEAVAALRCAAPALRLGRSTPSLRAPRATPRGEGAAHVLTGPYVGRGFSPADRSDEPLIIDVGTGSGCLAICLAREFPATRVVATDVSPAALAVAARNAQRHGVAPRIDFVRTSLLDAVVGQAALVVSNPPYIPTADIGQLDPEVRDWEPRQALDGGPDGLDLIRALLAVVPAALAPGGWFIMEFGFGQAASVERLVRDSPLELVRIVDDFQRIPRTVVARRK
jgi:release factor glutamine methyltransferase